MTESKTKFSRVFWEKKGNYSIVYKKLIERNMKRKILGTLVLLTLPLVADVNVVVLSGSLREDSWNKKLAKEAASYAVKKGTNVTYFDLAQFPLPFFNADLETKKGMPENAKIIRRSIAKSDAVIIASPNYNGSMSGVLKNMLDWMSRTEDGQDSRSIFKGKKVAIMSASGGKSGGAGGLPHLQHVIEKLGGTVAKTQLSVSKAHTKFDNNGHLFDSPDKDGLIREVKEVLNM